MRLYLALAVLMLALFAYAEAQDDPVDQQVASFTETVAQAGRTLAEKAKAGVERFQNSDFAVNTKNWFETMFEKAKNSIQEITN